MRAIEAYELKAFRDNRSRWKIAMHDFDKWAHAHWAPSGHAHSETPTLPTPEAANVRTVKAENDLLRERLDAALNRAVAAEADRDRWRSMAEKMAGQPRRRWWLW